MFDTVPTELPDHLDLVARDDLAGVGEHRLDLVARAAREEQHGHGHDDHAERAECGDPHDLDELLTACRTAAT